ncbi:uncharacterized protein C16orf46 homolog isoform 2-T2 [Spinachia spinachia]
MMATLKEVESTSVNRSDQELWGQTPERRHVDILLDISEEDFIKEMEPHEYHCYSGLEEAVRGWARAAPLSCILLTQKSCKKTKQADNPMPSCADPTTPDANDSTCIAENSLKKSLALNQHAGYSGNTVLAALQWEASEWTVFNSMQKSTSRRPLREKVQREEALRLTSAQAPHFRSKYSDSSAAKSQKHRPNMVVPIKNVPFLPPITLPPPQLHKASGKKAPEGASTGQNIFTAKSGTRAAGTDHVADPELPTYSAVVTSKYWPCQHNPDLFSAASVSVPKRYQVPMSFNLDTAHRSSYALARRLSQILHSPPGAHALLYPSKTMATYYAVT